MENQEYAGFWIRVAASLIDTIVFLPLIAIPLTLIYGTDYWTSPRSVSGFWDVLIQYVIPIFVVVWFWTRYMVTPGKMLLRLRVVDAETGQAISVPKAIRPIPGLLRFDDTPVSGLYLGGLRQEEAGLP